MGESVVQHGVFMEVWALGVLITGGSGVGKSELALELLSRGHRLIADDAPQFTRAADGTLCGRCPPALADFLEVRGLGILDIRAAFGGQALRDTARLDLIMHLEPMRSPQVRNLDRLTGARHTRTLLDVAIPALTLLVAPGRNLAVLVEAATRDYALRLKGYDASARFIARQQVLTDRGAMP